MATKFLEYKPDFSPYFKSPFSPGFTKWIKGDDEGACIVGSMAEAMYGVPKILTYKAKEKLPKEFVRILERGYKSKKHEIDTIDK